MAMAAIARGDDVRLVQEEARITAVESRAMGIHVNFAPVADVNNNPRNPVINTRSYGEDPARVAALVAAYLQGARDGGMIATLKHFPGHGDTDVDSHIGLPVVTFDRARLDRLELVPFKFGMEQGAGAVMAAHIELPALDPTPSTPPRSARRCSAACCATSSDSAASSTPTRCQWTRWRRCCRPAKAPCAPFSAARISCCTRRIRSPRSRA
jgi:beta-glucosidase-like glycosyl hydrolase